MRRSCRLARVAAPFLALALAATASAKTLTPEQASQAIGKHATVCGVVASAHFAMSSRGEPTFLNLGKAYPNEIFTALVWGADRSKFNKPPESLQGQTICVTGKVKEYRGTPEIIVRNPSQIRSRD